MIRLTANDAVESVESGRCHAAFNAIRGIIVPEVVLWFFAGSFLLSLAARLPFKRMSSFGPRHA